MANLSHVQVASHGRDAIQEWRNEHRSERLDLSGAFLSTAQLQGADLSRSDLSEADLSGGHLRGANLRGSNMERAHLHRAEMADTDLSGARLMDAYLPGADMSQSKLGRANLRGADLSRVNLSGADLARANLTGAVLFRASLRGANLAGATLTGADLSWTDLCEADLNEAHFIEAKLAHANLEGANFHRAFLLNTIFADCDLGRANHLAEALHRGPSTVGIDTMLRSAGNIPSEFLRGVGVPDAFIAYEQATPGSIRRRYGCYISYAHAERELAIRLQSDLRTRGVECWRFPAAPTGAGYLEEELDRGVRFYDQLVVVCSQESLANESVRNEISQAAQKQRETEKWVLFLVVVDDTIYQRQDRPTRMLRQHVLLDLRQHEDEDAYTVAIEQLAADLSSDRDASKGMVAS
jgi:uncharacterized protein YjbI with pentapeptide repeats